ncbi:hypothetical protein [Streptomyces syringium]|uniref:hypothetical protein n=1 Tax=Streptomyces syringium TaxID=76729 RepID=UPI0033D61EC5
MSNGWPRKKAVDEVAPLIDVMLRRRSSSRVRWCTSGLVKDYGSTFNYQRVRAT